MNKFNKTVLSQLCDIAIDAAKSAGDYIATIDIETVSRQNKPSGTSPASQVVTEVDLFCDQLIRDKLAESCQRWQLALLTEESNDVSSTNHPRLQSDYFWCVDPLDGTLSFIEGRNGFAVSIALISQTGKPIIGVVYNPSTQDLYHAIAGDGSFKNGLPLSAVKFESTVPKSLQFYADQSFRATNHYFEDIANISSIAHSLGCTQVKEFYGNGAVLNALSVLNHPFGCYFKTPKITDGGGSIWDFAATACIVKEAGGWVSNMQGKSLHLNRPDSTFMNSQGVLFANSHQLAQQLLSIAKPTNQ